MQLVASVHLELRLSNPTCCTCPHQRMF